MEEALQKTLDCLDKQGQKLDLDAYCDLLDALIEEIGLKKEAADSDRKFASGDIL